jgi:hypothetical protein
MGKLVGSLGISTESTAEAAVAQAIERARADLGGAPPGLAFVTCTVDHDAGRVRAAARALLPDTPLHGITTSLGVLGTNGITMGPGGVVGVLLLGGDARFAVGSALIEGDGRAAGRAAARELVASLGDARPGLVLFNASPGHEEDVLAGVDDVLPNVPVHGGSAADHAIAGEWKVLTREGARADGVSLAAIAGDVAIGTALVVPYRATGETARVTRTEGRTIVELDGRPASATLAAWVGDGIATQVHEGGNVLAQTALRPLGRRVGSGDDAPWVTMHPAAVHRDGRVDVFARAEEGQTLCRMEGTPGALVEVLERVVEQALARGGLTREKVRAGVLIYCAGCAGSIGGALDDALRSKLGAALPGIPVLGLCTFGEQGHLPGLGNVHANLAVGLALLGDR